MNDLPLIIVHNEIQDEKLEIEVIKKSSFGLQVVVTFKEDSPLSKSLGHKAVETYNNVTEVHYGYDRSRKPDMSMSMVAFESAIHKTGMTWCIRDIEQISVKDSTKKETCF